MIVYTAKFSNNNCGIVAKDNGICVRVLDDICDNKIDILSLVDMCNELEIELCQIDDIIEDYLTDFTV